MQGTAADIIKVAMIGIHAGLRAEGRAARLVLQVHDELLLEVPETETAVRDLVREEMCGVPARPAARGRRRHRRRLGRGEVLSPRR